MDWEHGGDWAGYQAQYGREALDFSASVSPLGMPEAARYAAVEALAQAERYPDPRCRALRAALSARHGVPAESIVCGAGAAELIYRLAAALRPGSALIPAPSFSEYARALELHGCRVRRFPLREEDGFHLTEAILEQVSPDTGLLVLCEPNNPTGLCTPPALLRELLRRCRETGTLLLADECFLPFLDEPERRSLIPALGGGRLCVLRAFTKFYGMAGLRLGYCLTDEPGLAALLERSGPPWAVSSPAQAAGLAALEDTAYPAALRALIREQRALLYDGLCALGLRVIPGEANFLLFHSEDAQLGEKLRHEGLLLRDCGGFPGLAPGWYRAAVRGAADNARLLSALRRVLS